MFQVIFGLALLNSSSSDLRGFGKLFYTEYKVLCFLNSYLGDIRDQIQVLDMVDKIAISELSPVLSSFFIVLNLYLCMYERFACV